MTTADYELPRSCAEARELGGKRYFTGDPCKHGHIAPRLVSNRRCIACSYEATQAWKDNNPEHMAAYRKQFYANNKDEVLANWADWYAENHERELTKKRVRYVKNKDANLEYAKKYRDENPGAVKAATLKWKEENPDRVKAGWQSWYAANGKARDRLRRSSPKCKIDDVMSCAIYGAIKSKKAGRKWEALVGYTVDDLMAHLECQFTDGMTWENHGQYGWHIDHIIPRSVFNYEAPEDIDFKRCWAISNLQPLWWRENIAKGARLDAPFQPSLLLADNDNHHNY